MSKKVTQKDSVLMLNAGEEKSLFEATSFGQLFYARDVSELDNTEPPKKDDWIHLPAFLGNLLVFMEHSGGLLGQLGYQGNTLLRMMLKPDQIDNVY